LGIGAAFFGWLTATGTAVLLTALVAAAGTAVGLATGSNAREAASNVASASRTTRLVGAIAVLVVVLGAVAGEKYNIFAQLNVFPRIPVNEGLLTTSGILTAVAVALASLLGAMLGGGSRDAFHRKVDRAGYTADATLFFPDGVVVSGNLG